MSGKTLVCKFGGSSTADAAQFRRIQSILDANPARRAVVVSAPGKRTSAETKLTDLLYAVYDLSSRRLDFSQPFGLIRERFLEIARDLSLNTDVGRDLDSIEQKLREHPESITVDFVVSRGEYLNAKLMAEFLGWTFVDAFDLIDIDAFHRVSGDGYTKMSQRLAGIERMVVPGFYARNHQGELQTFSRGGSDITGALLASALDAEVYENWTDVSGLLMADPRLIPNPRPMPYVSYREIRELSYSGASVLHDEAIAPCKVKGIPINIRNTNRPEDDGTMIGPKPAHSTRVVTGIAGRKNFSMIYIEKDMMNKERGFGARLLSILSELGISYEHSPTGIDSMSVIVSQEQLVAKREVLIDTIGRQLQPDKIKIFDDIALIATVGHGMTGKVGVAACLFSALAAQRVNIRVIDQGSSELNIIVGVGHEDYQKAIEAIYQAFVNQETEP